MNRQSFNPPGFIVGVDRSGTTILAAILNRHPKLYVLPETHFFSILGTDQKLSNCFQVSWPKSLDQLIEKMNTIRRDDFAEWGPPLEVIHKQVSKEDAEPKAVFEALGRSLAKSNGKDLWLEKTPGHIRHLSKIREEFPKAPIVHIIRDGRDVAHSLTNVYWGNKVYWVNLLLWVNDVSQARGWLEKDANSISIRYEDLVKEPGLTIAKVCNFLNLDFYAEILQPDGSEYALIEKGSSHKEGVKKPLDDSKVARWRRIMPEESKRIALIIAGNELKKWGYEDHHTMPKKFHSLRLSKNIIYSCHNRPQFDRLL
ncbi:sulfotransferase, partial [bacterium]|nr:sulfotransferase [bacterium]